MKKVIKLDNHPTVLPVWKTLVIYLALDHWHAATWVWWLFTIITLWMWVAAIVRMSTTIQVDLKDVLETEFKREQEREVKRAAFEQEFNDRFEAAKKAGGY